MLSVPVDALAAVTQLVEQRAEGSELLVDVRVVALDHGHVRAVLARHRSFAGGFPVDAAERLGQFADTVVLHRDGDQILLDTQITNRHLGEGLGDAFVDFPVGTRLPGRIDGRGQRVDEGVHVRGVHVVLLVPGCRRQHDVRVDAGGRHAEVQGGDQIELADRAFVDPFDIVGLEAATFAEVVAHQPVLGAQQVLEHVLVALARAAQQVGAPDEHVAREVDRAVRLLAGETQGIVLQRLEHVFHRRHAGRLGILGDLQRVAVHLRGARQPAGAFGADVVVQRVLGELRLVGQRREHFVHAHLFMAPLRTVGVEEAGAVHVPRRTAPVQAKGQGQPAALRTQFFLADVVGPAATGLTDATAQHQHVDQATVVHVHVVPVVHRRTDDDHGATLGLVGVVGKFAGDLDRLLTADTGNLFLPGRGTRHAGVVVVLGDVAATQTAVDRQVGGRQVEHGGDLGLAAVGQGDAAHRYAAQLHVFAGDMLEVFVGLAAEIREGHFGDFFADQAQLQLDFATGTAFAGLDVPLALLAPAVADRTQRRHQLIGVAVQRDGLPLGVVFLTEVVGQIGGAQEAVRLVAVQLRRGTDVVLEQHQHREVGVATHVIGEVGTRLVEVELFEDDVVERLRQGRIGALLGVQPEVGELGHLGVVRGDRDGLGALVTHLGEEVRVRGARLRHVGAPGDDVVGVVPVGRFRHVGLLAPGLRAGGRQVAVPVVEGQAHAADQRQVTCTRGVADHRHGRDRREADHAVRAVLLDGVDVGRGDDLVDFVPARADEAAHAALALVAGGLGRILDDARPGLYRGHGGPRFAPELQQRLAHLGVLQTVGAIDVPAVAGTTRTTAWLVVGQIVAGTRVVGLLGFPGDQTVLHVDLPRAGPSAVHSVGGTHDLVVLPARTVDVLPIAGLYAGFAMTIGELTLFAVEETQLVEYVTHLFFLSGLQQDLGPTHAMIRFFTAPPSSGFRHRLRVESCPFSRGFPRLCASTTTRSPGCS
ncbi:hypothetical protein D3C85_458270 [compost metagenome]